MRVIILGQGAIGSLLAARCQSQIIPYAVLPRTVGVKPVQFTWLNGSQLDFKPPEIRIEQLASDDVIILPIKAYQIQPAIIQLQPFINTQTLVLLNNGMGALDQAHELLPHASIISGVTRFAALKSNQQVTETGRGLTDLGWQQISNSLNREDITSILEPILSPCVWHKSLASAQWQKLAINAVINPLTAIYKCKNGQLADTQYTEQKQALLNEIINLMQSLNIEGWQTLPDILEQVIQATANNYSSMYKDVESGKQTEIDFINGYVVKQAQKNGLYCNANKQVWLKIKEINREK